MKELEKLMADAARMRTKRAALAARPAQVDAAYQEKQNKLLQTCQQTKKNLEAGRDSACGALDAKATAEIQSFSQKKADLQSYLTPVLALCPKDARRSYLPNPGRANEGQINLLLSRIREQGILAWLRRLFHLGGYASRQEMAMSVFRQISDACAYCDERIQAAEAGRTHGRQNLVTQTRRKIEDAESRYQQEKKVLEQQHQQEKQAAVTDLMAFDNGAELRQLRAQAHQQMALAEKAFGEWGQYQIPGAMPRKIHFCDVSLTLPDNNGIDRRHVLPLNVDLFTSNIIVFSTNAGITSENARRAKLQVRKFLARMLKAVPPEWVSYTIFDSLHMGGSLERLIDVTQMGTTDLHFDLFTSEDRTEGKVSCADRRKFLRTRISDIMQSIAGRYDSLYAYNQNTSVLEYPFSWIVDFHFPDQPDQRRLTEMRELFVNASAAGYSFIFVTTPEGAKSIDALAKVHTHIQVLHVDCDNLTCSKGSFSAPLLCKSSPTADQIGNFTTALKQFYEAGNTVDNRLFQVLSKYGIRKMDATRKVTIPFAVDSRGKLIELALGGSSVHGFISGGTSSGKSTLLHSIILSACLHYHPDDLHIWLADFKQMEFPLYRNNTPPHIKVIGASKTAEFSFSFLDKIWQEFERRTALMNAFSVRDLEGYRRHAGEPGYVNLPRLLIIIDEFHEMSQFLAGVSDYKDRLENILRESRSAGINMLIADQGFSAGLAGLSTPARGQIATRIAMRNEVAPEEIRITLEVDRALYSDSIEQTINLMRQGDFIMKRYIRNSRGDLIDVRLEKFRGLLSVDADIPAIGAALRSTYRGQFNPQDLIYVNTKEQVPWSDQDIADLDHNHPLQSSDIRLYLGRCASMLPCFALDMGRYPNENLSILGPKAPQRLDLIRAILRSCACRGYKVILFAAEFGELMLRHGEEIRSLCRTIPNLELLETMDDWSRRLPELQSALRSRTPMEDTVCLFLGLDQAIKHFQNLPDWKEDSGPSRFARSAMGAPPAFYVPGGNPFSSVAGSAPQPFAPPPDPAPQEFNAIPMIDLIFRDGPRHGIRCVAEFAAFRDLSKPLRLRDYCRHKIAFAIPADDCMQYMGSAKVQKDIGDFALYYDSGSKYQKLLPYQ